MACSPIGRFITVCNPTCTSHGSHVLAVKRSKQRCQAAGVSSWSSGWAGVCRSRVGRGLVFRVAAIRARSAAVWIGEVGALLQPEPQQPVGVLVRAALPGRVRVAEVDRHVELELDRCVGGELGAAVPGQRPAQVLGQPAHLADHRLGDRLGVVAPGRCSRIVNRVERSTRVPTAEPLAVPMIRSPSQWPGTARSATSAGRWLILNASRYEVRPAPVAVLPAGLACAAFQAELSVQVGAQMSRGSGHTAPGRSSRATPGPCSRAVIARRSTRAISPGDQPSSIQSSIRRHRPGFSTSLNVLGSPAALVGGRGARPRRSRSRRGRGCARPHGRSPTCPGRSSCADLGIGQLCVATRPRSPPGPRWSTAAAAFPAQDTTAAPTGKTTTSAHLRNHHQPRLAPPPPSTVSGHAEKLGSSYQRHARAHQIKELITGLTRNHSTHHNAPSQVALPTPPDFAVVGGADSARYPR